MKLYQFLKKAILRKRNQIYCVLKVIKLFSMRTYLSYLFLLLFLVSGKAQEVLSPSQPLYGPGGAEYIHDSLIIHNFAQTQDGFWMYEPTSPKPKSANVIVFIHGYGAYNPMIYGAWIKHLVLKGNIVIFPRYQKNLLSPSTNKFVENTANGIREALQELQNGDYVQPIIDQISLVGHSYGGVISANLGVNYKELDIPYPNAIMLCSPGTGPFRGGLLDDYKSMPSTTKLLVLVSEDDKTVGDKIGRLVYETAINVKNRNLLRQFEDKHGKPKITAGHNESYALDTSFDSGDWNVSTKRANKKGTVDAMDYYGYWKLFDALLDCAQMGNNCHFAFGNTPQQRSLGVWSDGTQIKEFEVLIPEEKPEIINAQNGASTH